MPEQQENEGWQEALQKIEEAKRSGSADLDLSGLGLATIPDSLAQLTNLQTVELRRNRLTAIPESLAHLSKLEHLSLSNNQLTVIPDFLVQPTNLRRLNLSYNQLTAIPDSLAQLTSLRDLELDGNQLTAMPASLDKLTNLQYLSLGGNQLPAIPASLAQLENLLGIYLSGNQITEIPDFFAQLTKLQILYLSDNRISEITNFLGRLTNLRTLILRKNQLTTIPYSLTQLTNLTELTLSDNPLPEELLAALRRGIPSLFRYLERTAVRRVYPRTVKLVLLGEPKSGKTTLLEALKGNLHPCDEARLETLGVDVVNIAKAHPEDKQPMYLSVWDFAGQHMEHATHQFFLTENAIYLILWNARQGTASGKRDLWYWLELLKMRVREPKFLLVATHTELTPPDLNLADIERNYRGCEGHFPVELSTLNGMAPLEGKILELAASSPSLKAEWPPEWLTLRDAVRNIREKQPYMTPSEFRKMMDKYGVKQDQAEKDAVGQLHELGEILYFQERDELSSLVILDPKWVTELIALVVRSKQARAHNGILLKHDLDALWEKSNLASDVRDHLIHLMDWFDLTYSTNHAKEVGIVVEALPYATPDDLQKIELPAGRPEMEMIFRFPSIQRHLPPGIPTWGYARAHRFSKCTPWRDAAAFEDSETKSEGVIVASDITKEVRLRVAADYPPFFFGRLEAILRDTFKRYPGVEPERRLPCPCQPGCPTSYLYETVLKRWHDRKPNVTCDKSGEDVSVESLLTGARQPDTAEGWQALKSEMRRIATEQLRAQNEQMEKTCPSIFTLVPSRDFTQLETWFESMTKDDELELVLYCEDDSGWHATAHSVYRFKPGKEWFDSVKKYWNRFVSVTRYVGPLAKTIGKASKIVWAEAAGLGIEKLPEAPRSPAGALSSMLGKKEQPEFIDIETRYLLERLINYLDSPRKITGEPTNGGLHRHLIEDRRLLWLCPDHLKLYKGRP